MRLRPSGRSGPVATSLPAFRRYQAEEAWTWEHLALTRARVVAGPAALGEAAHAAIAEVLAEPHDPARVLADAADMRRRLAEAHGAAAANPWEVKLGPGRMMDIELLAQTGALLHDPTGSAAPGACSPASARPAGSPAPTPPRSKPPSSAWPTCSRSCASPATTPSTRPTAAPAWCGSSSPPPASPTSTPSAARLADDAARSAAIIADRLARP